MEKNTTHLYCVIQLADSELIELVSPRTNVNSVLTTLSIYYRVWLGTSLSGNQHELESYADVYGLD